LVVLLRNYVTMMHGQQNIKNGWATIVVVGRLRVKLKYYTFERWSVVISTWNSVPENQGVIFWAKLLWPCCAMPHLVEGLCVLTATWPQHDKVDGCRGGRYLGKSGQNPRFYKIRNLNESFRHIFISPDSLMEWRFFLWRRYRKVFHCVLNSFALAHEPLRFPKLLARRQCTKWNTVSRLDCHWEKRLFKKLPLFLVVVSGRRNRDLPCTIVLNSGLTLWAVYRLISAVESSHFHLSRRHVIK
jgi:hypothetical protein